MKQVKHRWRDYVTVAGRRPVKDFVRTLSDTEIATVVAAMKEVAREGLVAARHLRGDIYEVRAFAETKDYRVLFAPVGRKGRVFLALVIFPKKTQKTPDRLLELGEQRLADWRARGTPKKR